VRWQTSISHALWRINAAWFTSERTPTNRIEGRVTASHIAAASTRRSSVGGYTASHKPQASSVRHGLSPNQGL
jgi:hypothetical protein